MNAIVRRYSYLVPITLGLLALSACSAKNDEVVDSAELRILETTDIHSYILPFNYYRETADYSTGLVQVAALVEQQRVETPNVLLFDNGDLIQGNPIADYFVQSGSDDPHPVHQVMNAIGYDAGNVGNHEFNYGLEFLDETLAKADFPYISANVIDTDGDYHFSPYVILERELTTASGVTAPIKIGVIGFVPPAIMNWDKDKLVGKVSALDIVKQAEKLVPEMQAAGADIIIAIAHSGLRPKGFSKENNARQEALKSKPMEENAGYFLTTVAGIDALLLGHSHSLFPSEKYSDLPNTNIEKGIINDTAVVQANFWGSHLGTIDLQLNLTAAGNWIVADSQSYNLPISKKEDKKVIALVETPEKYAALVADEHEAIRVYMSRPIGTSEAHLHSYFAQVQDDATTQIVSDSQIWYVKKFIEGTEYEGMPVISAIAPFKTGFGSANSYIDISAGELVYRNASDLYLYPNTLYALQISGAELKNWLERSAGAFMQIDPNSATEQNIINTAMPSYNFDIIDGVTYQIDTTQPARYNREGEVIHADATRIVNLQYEGKPVEATDTFILVTNNYRANGGGNFPGVKDENIIIRSPDENRHILSSYIQEMGTINPAPDNNWSIVRNFGEAKPYIKSAASAQGLVDEQLRYLRDAGEGYAIYSVQ